MRRRKPISKRIISRANGWWFSTSGCRNGGARRVCSRPAPRRRPRQRVRFMSAVEELFDDANGDLAIGELESAVEKYRRCVELDPAFFDGWHALGMALMKLGRSAEAIDAGLKTVELRPNDQLAWSSLSLFCVRNHQ